jgi:hypothetical protein
MAMKVQKFKQKEETIQLYGETDFLQRSKNPSTITGIFVFFYDTVSLYSPCWPQTSNPPALAY